MASFTIESRPRTDGSMRYRVLVRIKEKGKIVYRESRTFSKEKPAKSWGTQRVSHLESHGVPCEKEESCTIGELIRKYKAYPELYNQCGRTKRFVLEMLADCDIAMVDVKELEQKDIIDHCKDRKDAGAGPSTINHDVSYLRSVYKVAKPVFGINVSDAIFEETLPLLKSMKLVGKSQRRNRRAAGHEIKALEKALIEREKDARGKIPFVDILNFSILSCMRIGEVCRIKWEDIDEEKRTVIVRDRKDPRKKQGNHMVVPLLGDSWSILMRQPKSDERIFPYNERSVTAGFQRVRKKIADDSEDQELKLIKSLRYHDLRREGASRLFEAGFSIEEVAQVTGHRNLNTLWNVYRELYPEDLHSKFNQATNRTEPS